jgi:hypothetical protein
VVHQGTLAEASSFPIPRCKGDSVMDPKGVRIRFAAWEDVEADADRRDREEWKKIKSQDAVYFRFIRVYDTDVHFHATTEEEMMDELFFS